MAIFLRHFMVNWCHRRLGEKSTHAVLWRRGKLLGIGLDQKIVPDGESDGRRGNLALEKLKP